MPDQLQGIVQRMLDAGESEDNIATVIRHFKTQAPPPVERGGLMHPLTSMVAPELEAVRGTVNDALATPHGTPIMARSRTGALYPSETGTGAVNAGKNFTKGFVSGQGGIIDQAEGMTSPVGALVGAVGAIGPSRIAGAAIRTTASAGDFVHPDLIGVISPRGAKVVKIAQRLRTAMDAPSAGGGASVPARSLESTARVLDPVEVPQPQATSGLSSADRAQLAKQGYSPELIDKIATQAQSGVVAPKGGFIRAGRIEPVPSHAPAVGPDMVPVGDEAAYNAAHASPSPTTQGDVQLLPKDQIRRDLMDPEMVRKATEMQRGAAPAQTTPPDMAAQEARFNRGSQRLGREQGMTRADAQAQTDSVQGTRAETSLVAPWQAQQRMMAKMEALRQADPTGRSIVEYIDQAADPKTKAALINWERQSAFSAGRAPFYALGGAAVAPSVRDMLLQRMRAGVTAPQTAQ